MPRTVAIMYDFDKTLCTKDMQEYGFIPSLSMSAEEFWHGVQMQTKRDNMDACLSYMYYMMKQAKLHNHPLRRQDLAATAKDIELFPGLSEWFKRVEEYGKERGLVVEHYIISSGLKEIIEGSTIAPFFRKIYASEFHYDENGEADWPSMAVNYTNKTQFLFRINKGTLDISDDSINERLAEADKPIPFRNMIYIGDGMTDVPCMSLVKQYGGHSIAVHQGNCNTCLKLIHQNRVTHFARADYTYGSELDVIIRALLDKIEIDEKLDELHARQLSKGND